MVRNIIKKITGMAIVAALLFVVSCSDDDKNDFSQYLKKGKDERPSWKIPDDMYKNFEFTMSVQVIPQDELLPYFSDDDLMCATIGGEVRAISNLQRTGGEPYFPLLIAGDSGSAHVSISYYCSRLKRIYSIEDWMPFTPGMSPMQDGKPYVLNFFPIEK